MEKAAKLPLNKLIEYFQLEVLFAPQNMESVVITKSDINRPGLQMIGFSKFFDSTRIQIMGKVEFTFLEEFPTEEREEKLERFFELGFPVLVITRGQQIFPEMMELAESYRSQLPENQMTVRSDDVTLLFSKADAGKFDIIVASKEIADEFKLQTAYGDETEVIEVSQ